jgi:hypothetical protein
MEPKHKDVELLFWMLLCVGLLGFTTCVAKHEAARAVATERSRLRRLEWERQEREADVEQRVAERQAAEEPEGE